MGHHYTAPSRLTRVAYRLLYDPLRAGYLRALVASLELDGTECVLDFGSGAGSEALYLAPALARGGRLTCLDVSPTWLAEARHRLRGQPNVDFLLGEAPTVALADAAYDVILAHFVLHDVDRAALPAALAALARSLRPGGRFVVVEPDTSRGLWGRLVPSHHHLPAAELGSTIAAAGFVEQSRELVRPMGGSAVRSVYALASRGPAPARG
jgi:SAM-dependent methyltransferase